MELCSVDVRVTRSSSSLAHGEVLDAEILACGHFWYNINKTTESNIIMLNRKCDFTFFLVNWLSPTVGRIVIHANWKWIGTWIASTICYLIRKSLFCEDAVELEVLCGFFEYESWLIVFSRLFYMFQTTSSSWPKWYWGRIRWCGLAILFSGWRNLPRISHFWLCRMPDKLRGIREFGGKVPSLKEASTEPWDLNWTVVPVNGESPQSHGSWDWCIWILRTSSTLWWGIRLCVCLLCMQIFGLSFGVQGNHARISARYLPSLCKSQITESELCKYRCRSA